MSASRVIIGVHSSFWNNLESFAFHVPYFVGIVNLWRSPYLTVENHGGIFLILYFFCLMLIAVPLYVCEAFIGLHTNRGRLGAWTLMPLMRGVGWASLHLATFAMLSYLTIMAIGIIYLWHSFWNNLPWSQYDNDWNTASCTKLDQFGNSSTSAITGLNYTSDALSQTQFLNNYVWRIPNVESSFDGEFNWPMLYAFAAVFVLSMLNIKAAASKSEVCIVGACFLYILMVVLVVVGARLEGAAIGLRALFTFEWSLLMNPQTWGDAMSQALYSLGAGFLALTALGRNSRSGHNFCISAFSLALASVLTSLLMVVATYCVLGHLAYATGVAISDVVQPGPGLVFQLIPIIMDHMYVPQLWCVVFFLVLIIVAQDNVFCEFTGLMTVVGDARTIVDEAPCANRCCRVAIGLVFFILTIAPLSSVQAFYFFELIDSYRVIGFPLVFAGMLEVLAAGWFGQFHLKLHQTAGSRMASTIIYTVGNSLHQD
uniref:Sodium- and chloride-dependent creatine transporter 1-like n=1 Tax=Phallusia mammillata TaxID=59560 RepID=A0A6F9DTI9_9ASCI|nr:sodium- and chloride-dependent creatine transporter 1-like [Phallusia mammillata]